MSSETTMVAEQCRLQEWAEQIRECQCRPAGMSIVSWCACHGITKANYYYRLRRVREAC
ncbi:MAG: IS66 family insertion sequence element accessory protein TnpB, partial [Eubacterium sp.]|nr:IS66 family insertion sequence element accessory protein TnpB [Eubacterium sp.]